MENLFAALNAVLSFVTPVSDFFWDFPKMFSLEEYPHTGILLTSHYRARRFRYLFHFPAWFCPGPAFQSRGPYACHEEKYQDRISPLAAFLSAMRVGPGNMIGVTVPLLPAVRGPFLDVDICIFRHGYSFHGRYAGPAF